MTTPIDIIDAIGYVLGYRRTSKDAILIASYRAVSAYGIVYPASECCPKLRALILSSKL